MSGHLYVSLLRGGLRGPLFFLSGFPAIDTAGPRRGIDGSDVVFPGAAAARFLFWRHGLGRLVEWTGWWGTVLLPVMVPTVEGQTAKSVAPHRLRFRAAPFFSLRHARSGVVPLLAPLRSPLWPAKISLERQVLQGDDTALTPVPLPAGLALLGTALAGLGILWRRG